MGEHVKVAEDRPYTHSEIQKLLDHSSVRNRAMILLMSSAGLRVGALPILRLKDLEPIDKYNIWKVNVYAKSKKSAYFSFCSPEARKQISMYLDHRKRWGERLNDDSPLFRTDYNPLAVDRVVKPISTSRIRHFVTDALRDCGLRTVPLEGTFQRTNIMANHGFRKFFETNAYKAGMDHMYIRRLLGQKSSLEDAYLKLSQEDLLEGDSKHVGYVDIIDQLTIDESNKLRREVETLRVEKNSWQELRKEVDGLEGAASAGIVFSSFVPCLESITCCHVFPSLLCFQLQSILIFFVEFRVIFLKPFPIGRTAIEIFSEYLTSFRPKGFKHIFELVNPWPWFET